MDEYIKYKIISLTQAIVLLAILILFFDFILQPILLRISPLFADSEAIGKLARLITIAIGTLVYLVLKDPIGWYEILTSLFLGANHSDDGEN